MLKRIVGRIIKIKPEELLLRIPKYIIRKYIFDIYHGIKVPGIPKMEIDRNSLLTISTGHLKGYFEKNPFTWIYRVFNKTINLNEISDWRKDVLSGVTSPVLFSSFIRRQDYKQNGDIKYLAEISRFHFMPFIALKYLESGNEQYLKTISEILIGWRNQNPYLKSIHWTSGIEIGIRSVNLILTLQILKCCRADFTEVEENIKELSYLNYHYLKNHLSGYSSANNHLMAELMGIVAICSFYNFKNSEKSLKKYARVLERQIEKQVNNDYIHFELCTRYHAEVCDQILVSYLFLFNRGIKIKDSAMLRFQNMDRFLFDSQANDSLFEFGDSDDGNVILPYLESDFSIYKSVLYSFQIIFNKKYRGLNYSIDGRNFILFGKYTYDFPEITESGDEKNYSYNTYRNSGYIFYYKNNEGLKLAYDFGRIGDPLLSAHGHADIFHFILTVNNFNFIIDPGTFQYHERYLFWRDYFRGTKSHNAISVEFKDQAFQNTRMSWTHKPDISETKISDDGDSLTISANHNGFMKQGLGVVHRREIKIFHNINKIILTDDLLSGEYDTKYLFSMHFNNLVDKIDKNENEVILTKDKYKLCIKNKEFSSARIVSGDGDMPLGWRSTTYDIKIPTPALYLELPAGKNRLITELLY